MRRYVDEAVTAKVLDLVADELGALERALGGLFVELRALFEQMKQTTQAEEARHGATGIVDGRVHVLADAEAKRDVWRQLSERVAGMKLGADANRALSARLYRDFRAARRSGTTQNFAELGETFRAEIVDRFARSTITENFAALHDISVIEAIKRDALRLKTDWRAMLRARVDLVSRQSEPFVSLTDPAVGQKVMFWAVSPTVRAEINDDEFYNTLFTMQQGEAPLALPEFSNKELLCMNSRVNLELAHFTKLQPGIGGPDRNLPGEGRYYAAYRTMTESLTTAEIDPERPSRYFTPHIDASWHRPGVLVEISPELTRRQHAAVARAFVAALAFGFIERIHQYGDRVAHFVTVGRVRRGGVTVPLAETWAVDRLLRAFERRADLVHVTGEAMRDHLDRMRLEPAFAAERLGLLLDAAFFADLVSIAVPRDDAEAREARLLDLLREWAGLVEEVLALAEPAAAAPVRAREAQRRTQAACEQAFARLARDGVPAETVRGLGLVAGQALERLAQPFGGP
jgi:hypothetical protein